MGILTIENANFGYDTTGLRTTVDQINTHLVTEAGNVISKNVPIAISTVDEIWKGRSADAFKEKLSFDSDTVIESLSQLRECMESNIAAIAKNIDNMDIAIAESILGESIENSYTPAFSGVDISTNRSYKDYISKKSAVRSAVSNGINSFTNAMERTGATIGTAVLGLTEGLGEFGEALVDTGAIIGSVALSPITGLIDLGGWAYSKITGNSYDSLTSKMWDNTMSFVAEGHVKSVFDDMYDNTEFGNYLKNKSYGYETTRAVTSGLGYTAGVVGLSIVTLGVGGAVAGGAGATAAGVGATVSSASASAAMTTTMAAYGAAAGFGRSTETAWANGASLGQGLAYGAASGAWEGAQFYVGGKINGLNAFKSAGANIATRIALDTVDGAAEGFVQPALNAIYQDGTYKELFEKNGGWAAVGTQAAVGAIASTVGESNNISKAVTGESIPELIHNVFHDDKVVGGISIAGAAKIAGAQGGDYVPEAGFLDYLTKKKNGTPSVSPGSPNVVQPAVKPLSQAELKQIKYINDIVSSQGSAVVELKHSYDLSRSVLENIADPNAVKVQIQTSFLDLDGNFKPKYMKDRYLDRITYTANEAKDICGQLEYLHSQVDMSLPIEARAKQIHDIIREEYSDYMMEALDPANYPDAHRVSASLRGLTENNAVGKKGLVCAGYAQLYKEMCDRAGIKCDYVTGKGITPNGQARHAWNVVIAENGDKIPVDVCWSATSDQTWFGRSSEFAKGHIADVDELFNSYDLDRGSLDTIVQIMDSKYGPGAGVSGLQQFVDKGELNSITRDNGCREFIETVSPVNVQSYLNEISGKGMSNIGNNVSIPGSNINPAVVNVTPAPQVQVPINNDFYYQGIPNPNVLNASLGTRLNSVVQTMDAKYGAGAGMEALRALVTEQKFNYITSTNGCRDFIKTLSFEDVQKYLNGEVL